MLEMLGLTINQVSLVQAAIEVRDSGFKDSSREKLFSAMDLSSAQQAKLGLAIDLKDGSLNMDQLDQS